MRFVTEFELSPEDDDNMPLDKEIEYNKNMQHVEMGTMIGESFGWQNPVNSNYLHHRLEIECFPMYKCVEFKRKLFAHLGATGLYEPTFKDLITELESFGKPEIKQV